MNIIQGAPILSRFGNIGKPSGPGGVPRSALLLEYQAKTDSVQISAAGRQMHLHINREDAGNEPKEMAWAAITNALADKTLSFQPAVEFMPDYDASRTLRQKTPG
jgi:hypothetical protein